MTDAEIIQAVRTVAFPVIIALVVAIALRQLDRVMRHRLFGSESPEILIRDVVFFWGLAFLLTIPALAGAFGVILATSPVWVILSSTVGVALLAIVAYYEFRIIGRDR
jgi:hypothetical protein